jgi:hypothetical protein
MLGSGELVTGVRSTFGAAPQAVTPQSVKHAKSKQKPRIVDPTPRQSWYNRDGRSSSPKAGLIVGMSYLILSCPAKARHPVKHPTRSDYWIIRLRG